MPDSSRIDAALVTLLAGDATLTGLTGGAVSIDELPRGVLKGVIVSLVQESDDSKFGGRAMEDAVYRVTYVEQNTSGVTANAVAARIDVLLDGQILTATGYAPMLMQRTERIKATEVDEIDRDLRWQHAGGLYEIAQSPTADPLAPSGWIQPGWIQAP